MIARSCSRLMFKLNELERDKGIIRGRMEKKKHLHFITVVKVTVTGR